MDMIVNNFINRDLIKIKLLVKDWAKNGAGLFVVKTKYELFDGVLIDVDVVYKKHKQKITSQLLIAEDYSKKAIKEIHDSYSELLGFIN